METKNYYDAYPEHLTSDETALAELKTFAVGADSGERRHQVTLRASAEYNKRIRRTMLYHNKSYEDATRIVADQDRDLMCFYVFGELKD